MRTMVSKFVSVFIIICLITVGAFALSLVSAHEHAEGYSCPISTIKGASECTPGRCRYFFTHNHTFYSSYYTSYFYT